MNKIQRFLQAAIGLKRLPTGPSTLVATIVNGNVVWMADNTGAYIKDGYQGNDIVYSVVKRVEEKIKIAPWAQ